MSVLSKMSSYAEQLKYFCWNSARLAMFFALYSNSARTVGSAFGGKSRGTFRCCIHAEKRLSLCAGTKLLPSRGGRAASEEGVQPRPHFVASARQLSTR